MKKLLLASLFVTAYSGLFAGGIVTNTNQSTSWARNPSTGASTGIEAVYYNPAGIIKLDDGWHFSLNNQYISQSREIINSYPNLIYNDISNVSGYKGSVVAPLFPSVYAAYKKEKLAISMAFNPIGGGGSAEFKKGIPSLEVPVSDLVPALTKFGVSKYQMNAYFKGSAINYGLQFGATYEINKNISLFAGARYVMVKNTYEGYLKGVNVNYKGRSSWTSASSVLKDSIPYEINKNAIGLQNAINLGIIQASDPASANVVTGLAGLGIIATGFTNSNAIAAFQSAANTVANQNAIKAKLLADQSADVVQTGSGFCPILGLNLSLDKLNVGIKYEFVTKIKIKNETSKDFMTGFAANGDSITMFPNGAEIDADMPAMLSVGASYQVTEKMKAMAGGFMYFDKSANYGKKLNNVYVSNDKLIDNNFYEISAGLEYKVIDKLLLSAGCLYGKTGVKPEYNSDLSYSNSSTTIGLGGKYSINDKIDIDLGVAYALYQDNSKDMSYIVSGVPAPIAAKETYSKNTLIVGLGVNIKLAK